MNAEVRPSGEAAAPHAGGPGDAKTWDEYREAVLAINRPDLLTEFHRLCFADQRCCDEWPECAHVLAAGESGEQEPNHSLPVAARWVGDDEEAEFSIVPSAAASSPGGAE